MAKWSTRRAFTERWGKAFASSPRDGGCGVFEFWPHAVKMKADASTAATHTSLRFLTVRAWHTWRRTTPYTDPWPRRFRGNGGEAHRTRGWLWHEMKRSGARNG